MKIKVTDTRRTKQTFKTVESLNRGDFFLFADDLWVLLDKDYLLCYNVTGDYTQEFEDNCGVDIPELEIIVKGIINT